MTQSLLNKLRAFFATQPVVKAWLFGSYARGEETDNSDIDILVSFDRDAKVSLLRHAAMLVDLEDLLRRPVDLVNERSLFPEVSKQVDLDKILIYERKT
ncbi:MAG: nucleotidyltransferase domain-containing protein [Muribaculaceae bacterium]|nr:nucleotidyltransferase domain-containing protein [Muribaculaceae bacterium]